MPSTQQIVPKYSFPYIETVINNNTVRDNTSDADSSTVANTYPYLCVFTAGKGIDNKIVPVSGTTELYKIFGKPNYKKYGQPFMMADAILKQANTTLNAMRIMPDDAYYANSVLSIWYKADVENKKFYIKFTQKSLERNDKITNFNEIKTDLISRASGLDGVAENGVYVDAEGYTQIPAMVFITAGRGVYGNNYRWRINLNTDYEKGYGIKIYSYQCLDVENGTEVAANYAGGIVTSTKVQSATFINDVIEDSEEKDVPMDIHVFEENMETLYEAYVKFWNDVLEKDPSYEIDDKVYVDEIPDLDCFDPFYGKAVAKSRERVTKTLPFIFYVKEKTAEVNEEDEGYVAADWTSTKNVVVPGNVVGNSLENGSDGVFGTGEEIYLVASGNGAYYNKNGEYYDKSGNRNKTQDINVSDITTKLADASVTKGNLPVQDAIDECYINAFGGKYDKLILSPRRIPSESLFDANFNMPVKMALARLALYRNDALLYLDTNLLDTISEADITTLETDFSVIDNLESDFDVFANYLISFNLHYYRIKEESTGKRVPVTITYFLASTLPTHFRTVGYHVPFVNSYATLSGHVKNSLLPSIDTHENELKEILYNSRFNYFEATGENIFERSTQSTSSAEDSDLTEENNVITLMILKRLIEADVRATQYNFTSPTERSEFKDYIKAKYKYMIGTQLYSLSVQYEQSEFEFNRQITHLYLAVQFRPMSKISIVEIDVNRTTYDDANGQ